ncbi:Chemotaxis protein methyltransferase [Candidatus Zixiibacteriota bacterium]|nr:Chemotaxis protein methyltransferase [candidate division Zixibacteria bacterium]
MKETTFNKIRDLVYERSGISLGDNKQALVRARIAKRMRFLNIADYAEYYHYAVEDTSGEEIQQMLEAISTNVTSFYREPSHFDFMRESIDSWMASGRKALRFWSAASSTGEEPYTMAIEILETIGNRPADIKILATDISSRVLEISVTGEYTEDKVAPVPKHLRTKYFTRHGQNGRHIYRVNDRLRDMIIFRQFNLSTPPYPIRKQLDMIFCRNVMIYFDRRVRSGLIHEFNRLLKPGGYLLVGHAESITGMSDGFRCVRPSIYLKV